MTKVFCVGILLMAALLSLAKGQSATSASDLRPIRPFLATLPAETSWRVDYVSKATPSPNAVPTPKQITVTKAHGLRRATTMWNDGKETTDWMANGILFQQDRQSGQYSVFPANLNPYGAAGQSDFPDLNWVDLDHYQETKAKNLANCFLYAWKERLGAEPKPPAIAADDPAYRQKMDDYTRLESDYLAREGKFLGKPTEPVTLWVNAETKLPMTAESEDFTATYTFNLPSSGTLALPADCQKILDLINHEKKQIEGQRMARPPGLPPR